MANLQDKWDEYYADKIWIDTKGWCHLDGTPFTFEELRRQADKRASFLKTILKAMLYHFLWTLFMGVCLSIFYENTHTAIKLIHALVYHYISIRCIWIILKNLFKRNLKFW